MRKAATTMKMKLRKLGKDTFEVEVQDISKHGLWLYVKGNEYFLPFKEYPWFQRATLSEIHNVQLQHGMHLYWPDLDVDLELESLNYPEEYPLVYKKSA